MNNLDDLNKIINFYGEEKQVDMAIEEMAELIKALLKYKRFSTDETMENIIEEIADVSVMIDQLIVLIGCESYVEEIKQQKIKRTISVISKERKSLYKPEHECKTMREMEELK